jgi:hypothetical protein
MLPAAGRQSPNIADYFTIVIGDEFLIVAHTDRSDLGRSSVSLGLPGQASVQMVVSRVRLEGLPGRELCLQDAIACSSSTCASS